MDVPVRRAVTTALRLRSIDVLTAQEGGAAEFDDARLWQRATEHGRVLVSHDEDLLREGTRGVHLHPGILFGLSRNAVRNHPGIAFTLARIPRAED